MSNTDKIKITQDQADAIEHLLKEHEGNKDEIMDIHCNEDFEWEETHAFIKELKPSQLARALYTGYEVEQALSPRMKKFNVTVEWVMTKNVEIELENRFDVFDILTHDIVDDDGKYLEDSFRIGSIHEVD